ncbi:hypothetical protein BH09BAC6_BH09BAC6_09810 [soil metagenome]
MIKDPSPPLTVLPTPGTVYISTNPNQSSYANIAVSMHNPGSSTLQVNSIAITLPPALAPSGTLGSITPVTEPSALWNFGPSEFSVGEFDATAASGGYVAMSPGDTWSFELQMVTLVSTITQASATVTILVTFEDGSTNSTPFSIEIAPAVASIISFNAQPANINPGQSAQLSWKCEKINYCIVSPVNDNHLHASDTLSVSPENTTIYTLFAYGDGVILSAQWAISVQNAQIILFGGTAGQSGVNCGDNITLVWECNQFTESITLSDESGVPIPSLDENDNTPQKGSVTVGPITEPVTFTLTAYGNTKQNFDQRSAIINMNNLVYVMAANPSAGIWTGDDVSLKWTIESATAISLSPAVDNGPSLQNLQGSAIINPAQDVTYVLNVSGFINNVPVNRQLPLSIAVQPVVINSFTLNPNPITPDAGPNQGTLAWNVLGQVVSINNGIGSQPVILDRLLSAPVDGTVYTLTAGTYLNPGLASTDVTVINSYGPYTFNAMQTDPSYLVGMIFTVPVPGPMNVLKQGWGGGYLATFTGVVATGTPPAQYLAVAGFSQETPAQSFFSVVPWPFSNIPITFQWADPANQTGTILLTEGPDTDLEGISKFDDRFSG